MKESSLADADRRQFLRAVVSSTAVGVAAQVGMNLVSPARLSAQSNLSPDAALQEMLAGNQRFAANQLTSVEHDLVVLKERTADKQEPFAAVLSCADSRVPVELVFDQSIGHVFVTRVAGNLVTPEIIGSLEYGAIVLGTKAILILGHANCGAVKAAMENKPVPGQISALYRHIQPAVEQAKSNPEEAI